MTDSKTISVYDAQVDNYLDLIENLPDDQHLLDFIAKFNPNDYILDLGCGPAISSVTMREHGLRVDPIDASLGMVKVANNKFDIGARQASFQDINSKDTYDGVWANFSLLHASRKDFPSILAALKLALKSSGMLYIGMKIGDGSRRDKLDRLYTYYSQEELVSHIVKAGFTVEGVELGEAAGLAGDVEPWIAITSVA